VKITYAGLPAVVGYVGEQPEAMPQLFLEIASLFIIDNRL
jgi:hypothetical protein